MNPPPDIRWQQRLTNFELAWTTVKDYMEASGVVFDVVMPRQVIKDAFAAKVLNEGATWNSCTRCSSRRRWDEPAPPLQPSELELVRSVLRLHPEVDRATLFGSRAKGTHHERSDVDLALSGELGLLGAEAIAAELEELPLLEHIERVGVVIYAA
jgi:predicted nucleotidyltransferase